MLDEGVRQLSRQKKMLAVEQEIDERFIVKRDEMLAAFYGMTKEKKDAALRELLKALSCAL